MVAPAPLRNSASVRDFLAWDGEGVTNPETNAHYYIMLANSDGELIHRQTLDERGHCVGGLRTEEILTFLCGRRQWEALQTRRRAPHNIWFAFTYDVNMILQDLDLESLGKLWDNGFVRWNGFNIRYIPRKIFKVTNREGSFNSTDVFPFFQQSFVKACRKWKIEGIESIVAGKDARGSFAQWSFEDIVSYNETEMRLLVQLADALRDKLQGRCGLSINSWHGPGAVANSWLYREKAKFHYPEEEPLYIHHAYFGGRSDISIVGDVYAYKSDLASAYPAALAECISLNGASWNAVDPNISSLDPWGIYFVHWSIKRDSVHGCLPYRLADGTILYPPQGCGWYWGIELTAANYAFPGAITVQYGYEPHLPNVNRSRPLRDAIEREYETRRIWKNSGDLGHEALKLVLNSLYGKLAMSPVDANKTPPYRNIAWAGWITAWTRAQINYVIGKVGAQNVLSIATDGLLLRVPNPLGGSGNKLGAWQNEGSARTLIVCPGLYAHLGDGGESVTVKQRGLPGGLNYGYVLREWGCVTQLDTPGANSFSSSVTRFNGMGTVLKTSAPRNQFTEHIRTLSNVTEVGTSKRIPGTENRGAWMEFPLALRPAPNPLVTSVPYKRLGLEDEDAESYDEG